MGGRDRFVGLRHVLAAICNAAPGTALGQEFDAYLQSRNASREGLRSAILTNILSDPEPGEDAFAWAAYFRGETSAAPRPTAAEDTHRQVVSPASPPNAGRPAAAVPVSDVFAVATADDPLAAGLSDRLSMAREAEAFAMLATARAIRPPLAVGVFGQWGAGKSFFLRMIRDHVARIARPREKAHAFHEQVVPIVFNAWHYSDTNLWASLVDHIFTELDKWSSPVEDKPSLLDALASSRDFTLQSVQSLVKTRRERRDAEERYETAAQELAKVQKSYSKILATLARVTLDQVTADVSKRDAIQKAAKTLGLADTVSNAQELKDVLGELDSELQGVGIRGAIWRVGAGVIFLIVTALAVLVTPFVFAWVGEHVLKLTSTAALVLSGITAPLLAAGAYLLRTARSAVNTLQGARPLLDKARDVLQTESDAALEETKSELAEKEAAAEAAKATFDIAAARAFAAAEEFHGGTGGARLLRFVRDRVATGEYGRELGFVATIRRDFESLSQLMADIDATPAEVDAVSAEHLASVEAIIKDADDLLFPQEQAELRSGASIRPSPERTFSRIVLYIDDLDRCPPEKVVIVLQAIHLLLAFPLFVVFVAVDIDWLKTSLRAQYPNMGERTEDQATAADYLEKIFQIPYWVRAVDPTAAKGLLIDRLTALTPTSKPTLGPASFTVPGVVDELPSPRTDARSADDPRAPTDATAPRVEPLGLSTEEVAYVGDLAPSLVVSPRRIIRFINTYSLIKASLTPDSRGRLEGEDYPAVLTLLAIAVSLDDESHLVFDQLRAGLPLSESLLNEVIRADRKAMASSAISQFIQSGVDNQVVLFWLQNVERFTFAGPRGT